MVRGTPGNSPGVCLWRADRLSNFFARPNMETPSSRIYSVTAIRPGTGENLHIRNLQGKANTQRSVKRCVDQLLARVLRTNYHDLIVIRADSGFENHEVPEALDRRGSSPRSASEAAPG